MFQAAGAESTVPGLGKGACTHLPENRQGRHVFDNSREFSLRGDGLGFRVSGFEFRVWGFGFLVSSFGFLVSDFGFRVSGLGLKV